MASSLVNFWVHYKTVIERLTDCTIIIIIIIIIVIVIIIKVVE